MSFLEPYLNFQNTFFSIVVSTAQTKVKYLIPTDLIKNDMAFGNCTYLLAFERNSDS